jgi:hypothetical protein
VCRFFRSDWVGAAKACARSIFLGLTEAFPHNLHISHLFARFSIISSMILSF